MTLIQAQQRFIDRVTASHPGHQRRVRRAAWGQLFAWAEMRGFDAPQVCADARDMLNLELASDD